MFSLAKHRIDALVEENISGAETVAALKSDPHRLLVTILVGNNIVNIGDLVREQNYGEGSASLTDLVHPTLHVPESKSVDELLQKMQHERMQMAVVIDEFGTTEGLITMEDRIEEIVGDILKNDEEETFEFVDEDTCLVRGEVNIDEMNEMLELELPEDKELETLAGYVFNHAGRLVDGGEEITFEGGTIYVEQVDNTHIVRERVSKDGQVPDVERGQTV